MASTTRTITAMGMSQAAARAYVHTHAVTRIPGSNGCPSWVFQKNDGNQRPKDPGGSSG